MQQISFALTTRQFKNRSKIVTRRLGWGRLQPGARLMAVEKAQGLKHGEKAVRLGVIEIVDVRSERLDALLTRPSYGQAEVALEGFPEMSPAAFVAFFCDTHRVPFSTTGKGIARPTRRLQPFETVTRIQFRYCDD